MVNADGSGKRSLGEGDLGGWSPDGKQLVLAGLADQQLYVVNADGTGRKVVAPRVYGGKIAANFASWRRAARLHT